MDEDNATTRAEPDLPKKLIIDANLGRPSEFIRLTVEGINGECHAEFEIDRWLGMGEGQRDIQIRKQCYDTLREDPYAIIGFTIK